MLERILIKMKKYKIYIINTILVISIFIGILVISHTSPFGSYALGESDAIVQYKPFLYHFIQNIKNGTLKSFNFNNGLGNPTIFNYLYYLVSPLNLIALLFNNPDCMYLFVIIIKLIFTSIFMTLYTKKHNCNDYISLICCLSYIYSGWFLTYYFNIHWLDTFMIFPLLQLSLEELLNNKKYTGLIITFSYTFATNFLLGFSCLIYMIIYFIIYNFFYLKQDKKEKIKKSIIFILSIIVSFLLIIFYIYALIDSKNKMGISFSSITDSNYIVTNKDFFKSLIYGSTVLTTKIDIETSPNICMNIIIFISFIYYLFNKDISIKNKMYVLIGIDIVFMCIFGTWLDYILNMFHNITGFTFRYSFIICFLLIKVFINNVKNTKALNKKYIIISLLIYLVILLVNICDIDKLVIIMNLVCLIILFIITIFYKNNRLFNSVILILVICEIFIGAYLNIPCGKEMENYDLEWKNNDSMYRYNTLNTKDEIYNQNLYGNQDVTYLFTSMDYSDIMPLMKNLGCSVNSVQINCTDKSPIINMYFNVKNDYYLEKVFSVNKDILNIELDESSVKNSYSLLVESTTGIKDIFNKEEKIKPIKQDDKYIYNINYNFYLVDDNGYNYLGTKEIIESDTDKELTIYTIKEDKIKDIYNYLSKNQISYTHYEDTYIEGNINVLSNQMIFTSIPYDTSWNIYIDGKKVEPTKVLNSLIGIEVEEGSHTILLKYQNSNLIVWLVISIINIILFIVYVIIKKKGIKKVKT